MITNSYTNSTVNNNYQHNPEGEEDDEDECDNTLRESFSNKLTGKGISIVDAVNKAQNDEQKPKYNHDEDDVDLKQNNSDKILPSKDSGEEVNDIDDDQDDGFSASNHDEETDADDEIEEEGIKGSDRTPDSLLSPISDEMPPAKGWV